MHVKQKNIEYFYLYEKPQYANIISYLSFSQWYLNRKIPLEINNRVYQQRSIEKEIPTTIIALTGDFPLGMVSIKENDLWHRKDLSPWLASLFVHQDFRKQHIATNLVSKLVAHARKLCYEKIYLFLGTDNQDFLEKFYTNLGWKFLCNETDNDGCSTKVYSYSL